MTTFPSIQCKNCYKNEVKVKKIDHKKNQLSNQKELLSKIYIGVFSNSGAFQKCIHVLKKINSYREKGD